MTKKQIKIILAFLALIIIPAFSFAANIFVQTIEGTASKASSNTDIYGLIFGFYTFALVIAGILAMGAIIYGAILYAISSGNTSRQSDAKEWITQAFLGLLLLLAANLLLGTINPAIIKSNNSIAPKISNNQITGLPQAGTPRAPVTTPPTQNQGGSAYQQGTGAPATKQPSPPSNSTCLIGNCPW